MNSNFYKLNTKIYRVIRLILALSLLSGLFVGVCEGKEIESLGLRNSESLILESENISYSINAVPKQTTFYNNLGNSEYYKIKLTTVEESGIINEWKESVIFTDCSEKYEFGLKDYIDFYYSLLSVPEYVRDSFVMSGWTIYVVDCDICELSEYSMYLNANGLTDYEDESIWIDKGELIFDGKVVWHEFGHFVDVAMGLGESLDESLDKDSRLEDLGDWWIRRKGSINEKVFESEKESLIENIRPYAGESSIEAYAEIFRVLCQCRGDLEDERVEKIRENCSGCFEVVWNDWSRIEELGEIGVCGT